MIPSPAVSRREPAPTSPAPRADGVPPGARALRLRLLVAAGLSGAAVMILELSAARALAPVFGSSVHTWSNVIAVVLVGLAAGYAAGGKLADRRPEPALLGGILLLAAVLVVPIPFLIRPLGDALFPAPVPFDAWEGSSIEIWGSLATAAVLFAPPVTLMGTVGPFVTRCLVDSGLEGGRAAGAALAVSTFGSLLGTYLPAHLLLDWAGVRASFFTGAGALAVAGVLLVTSRNRTLMA